MGVHAPPSCSSAMHTPHRASSRSYTQPAHAPGTPLCIKHARQELCRDVLMCSLKGGQEGAEGIAGPERPPLEVGQEAAAGPLLHVGPREGVEMCEVCL
jgi:hypothetical protein